VKKFSAIIFDMDGVIVDSEPLHQKAFETLFEELGKKHDHGIVFHEYYGRSDGALLRDFIARHKVPCELEDLTQRKLKYFLNYTYSFTFMASVPRTAGKKVHETVKFHVTRVWPLETRGQALNDWLEAL
jgi:beta-phosphoglucomutase-like phosphatase (HAD superfamily)